MNFLESFFPKLFIVLRPSSQGVHFYAELRKNGTLVKQYDPQLFETYSALAKRVQAVEKENTLSYTAFLDTEADQGLFVQCRTTEHVELSSVETLCVENRWGIFMGKDDLFARQKMYKSIGLDFIFSPFSLLYHFYEERIRERDGLYLLITADFVLSAVFKNNTMLFGKKVMLQESLAFIDPAEIMESYSKTVQAIVKEFYDAKVDEAMFIEKIFIADELDFEAAFENQLEEILFVEVEKRYIDPGHELVLLSEKELR